MGILDAPPADPVYLRPLSVMHAVRDMPAMSGWWDANDLTGADSSAVGRWVDKSGNAQNVHQTTSANQPTLHTTGGPNGKQYLHFGATSWMGQAFFQRSGVATGGWQTHSSLAQPITCVAVARVSSAVSLQTRWLLSSTSSGTFRWGPANDADSMMFNCGGTGVHGGQPVNDDTWHVLVGVAGDSWSTQVVDGTVVSSQATRTHGTGAWVGLGIGSYGDGTLPMQNCDLAEVMIFNGGLSLKQISRLTAALGVKYGITVAACDQASIYGYDDTDANGSQVRYWVPPTPAAAIPWIIWSHPAGQNEQWSPDYSAFPLAFAAVQQGWGFIATRQHGDSWGNDTAVADILAAYTKANAVVPAASVVLGGASMGGVATATAVARGTIPGGKLKAAFGIDAVFDLVNAYTMDAGTYTTAINTAYGISAQGQIPAANDPMQESANSLAAVPWRFYASTTDPTVSKTNHTDAFHTRLASATTPPVEYAVNSHYGGHLSSYGVWPRDLVAFIKRYV